MKLAKIEHERCGEYDCATYVWVPEDWTEEQFSEAVYRATEAYLAVFREWHEGSKKSPNNATGWSKPDYTAHPDKTVAEVDALHEQQKAIYKEWEARREKARKNFGHYLELEGLVNFYAREPEFETCVYWGHRHGWRLEYSEDSPTKNDLPGPYKAELKAGKVIVANPFGED